MGPQFQPSSVTLTRLASKKLEIPLLCLFTLPASFFPKLRAHSPICPYVFLLQTATRLNDFWYLKQYLTSFFLQLTNTTHSHEYSIHESKCVQHLFYRHNSNSLTLKGLTYPADEAKAKARPQLQETAAT